MENHWSRFLIGTCIVLLGLCTLTQAAGAQNGAPKKVTAPAPEGKKNMAAAPTPRTADGHPDLNGLWNGGQGGIDDSGSADINVTFLARGGTPVNFERDNTLLRRMDSNRPIYKPEYWEKVQYNDQNEPTEDPSYGCLPLGVPRMGAPTQIIETPALVTFLYTYLGDGGGTISYRVIPTDGRAHTSEKELEGTWNGESLGHWEGDTFVIDTIGFNDTSWLSVSGYLHSENMHVVERLRREGNNLTYETTVEDPDVLLKPWVMNTRTLRLNPDPKAVVEESLPCSERDQSHLATKEHH